MLIPICSIVINCFEMCIRDRFEDVDTGVSVLDAAAAEEMLAAAE